MIDPIVPGGGNTGTVITGKYAINAGCLYYYNSSIDLKLLETDHTNYIGTTVTLPKSTFQN
jgi:hypothetical protein